MDISIARHKTTDSRPPRKPPNAYQFVNVENSRQALNQRSPLIAALIKRKLLIDRNSLATIRASKLSQELNPNLLLGTPHDATSPMRTAATEHKPEFVRDVAFACQCDPRSPLRNIADHAVAVRRAITRVYRCSLLHRCRQRLAGDFTQLGTPIAGSNNSH